MALNRIRFECCIEYGEKSRKKVFGENRTFLPMFSIFGQFFQFPPKFSQVYPKLGKIEGKGKGVDLDDEIGNKLKK